MNPIYKLFQQSSHYFIGQVVLIIGGFISFPILTRLFSENEYGILSLISITVFVLIAIAKLGLQQSSIRFYDEFKSGNRNQAVSVFYTTLFLGSLFISFVVAIFIVLIGFLLPEYIFDKDLKAYILLIAALAFTGSMIMKVISFFRAEQNTRIFNLILIGLRYGKIGSGLLIVFLIVNSAFGYYLGVLITEIILLVFITIKLFKENKLKWRGLDISFLKECIFFGYPLVGHELASYIVKFTDRYLIQFFLGLTAVGVYSVGADLSYYIQSLIYLPVQYAISPLYMEIWNNHGEQKTREFISQVSSYLLMISIPVLLGVMALGDEIVIFLASNKFEKASSVIPYIVMGTLAWGFYPIIAAGLYIHKKTNLLTLIIFISGAINVILNLILIPIFKLEGAAVASMITYLISIFTVMKISFKYLKIDFNLAPILRYVLGALLMYFIVQNLSFGEGLTFIIVGICIGIITYTSFLLLFEVEVRAIFFSFIKRVQHKKI